MAKRRRRRRRGGKLIPVLAALLLVILVSAAGIIASFIKKYTPSDTRMALKDYYGLASEEEAALILQDQVSEIKGKTEEGRFYIPYRVVTDTLGGRFYWDKETQSMLYTTPSEVIAIAPESVSYTQGGETMTEEYAPVRQFGEEYYIDLDFLKEHMQINAVVYEEPARAVIEYEWKTVSKATTANATKVRYQGGIKSPILEELPEGSSLTLLEQMENWSRVMTEDGVDGYVPNKDLTGQEEIEVVYQGDYTEEYTSLTRDHKINLVWHQVTSEAANQAFDQAVKDVTGVNVISPTWFSITAEEGTISSLASAEYVQKAHAKGMEVWGLIDNFDSEVSTLETLSSRSAREHLIQKLLEEAKRVGLDGINVDFEALTEEEAPHFIQFLRELSITCRANGLVLSVDDPVPQYTAFYNRKEQGIVADYVIIMGYDEHTAGSPTAGPVASLAFVEEGITQTLQEVPKEKVINGVPFYTRLWTVANNGTVTSEVLGMDEADQKASGMDVYWNKDVSQNYGEALTDSGTQKIWLEDEEALEEKMKLVQKYDLAGAAAWKLGFERASVWEIISKYIQ